MLDSLLIIILMYFFASIAGLIVIISLFKEKKTKKAILYLILYINVVHIGIGFRTVFAVNNGDYPLTELIENQTFVNVDKDNNSPEQMDQLVFGEDSTLFIYTENDEKETPYQMIGRDQFYLPQAYNGLTNNGQIKRHFTKVTITITSPSGTMVFVKKRE